ncbi:MAG: energy transducer TonB [Deltaproteobacteria bacterium]|jgi:protein TonB|nr:energy transducer TonB [Deltaproteobacteria bacterium]MDH4008261.1 energy transducer TonB [Desulfuromonadales bacterium]
MTAEQRQNRIITGFVLLSLLLHLLLLLVPKDRLFPVEMAPPPVYVEVRPPQALDRELDLPIREELEKPREKPAERLAEKDQVVEKETAPEGQDTEDREPVVQAPQPVSRPQPPTPPRPEPSPEKPKADESDQTLAETLEGWKQKKTEPPRKLPDLETLTQISPQAMAQIESDWRQKYRKDIERGDTVWMDTQQDLLISFMRRFRNNIYGVWNYPESARRQNQQGSCLLRITVDRDGNITDVKLMESSGYRVLDDEAMRAVRQGATYGPLPRAYPNEYLHIMALFNYQMGGSSGYQRRSLY